MTETPKSKVKITNALGGDTMKNLSDITTAEIKTAIDKIAKAYLTINKQDLECIKIELYSNPQGDFKVLTFKESNPTMTANFIPVRIQYKNEKSRYYINAEQKKFARDITNDSTTKLESTWISPNINTEVEFIIAKENTTPCPEDAINNKTNDDKKQSYSTISEKDGTWYMTRNIWYNKSGAYNSKGHFKSFTAEKKTQADAEKALAKWNDNHPTI